MYTWQNVEPFIRDVPTLSSERILRHGFDSKGSVAKNKKKKSLIVILEVQGAAT
jgi:hypothetical protein